MGRFDDLLLELARDPAMIVWLDNQENHKDAINENWGRELLELFSMGVGNYSEDDIKECARAFTGWTLGNTEYMVAAVYARLRLAIRPYCLAFSSIARTTTTATKRPSSGTPENSMAKTLSVSSVSRKPQRDS